MAANFILRSLRDAKDKHPLTISKSAPQIAPQIRPPSINERVQVRFNKTSLSPGTIVGYDSEDGTYLVHLSLIDQIEKVAPDQVQRLVISMMKPPPMTTSTTLPKLVGPTRRQLEWHHLEIKALCYWSKNGLARAWLKWASMKAERLRRSARIAAKKQAEAEAAAAVKAKRHKAVFGKHGGVLGKLKNTFEDEHAQIKQEWLAHRLAIHPEAVRQYQELKHGAEAAWDSNDITECKQLLDMCIKLNGHCDSLFNFRARVNDRAGHTREALDDARRAVSLWHRTDNHLLLSRLLQQEQRLDEASLHFMAAHKRGGDGVVATRDDDYRGLVISIRRKRNFCNVRRPDQAKVVETRTSVIEKPDPPDLTGEAVSASDSASILARWTPVEGSDAAGTYEYVLQHCEEMTIFEPKQRKFQVSYGPWVTTTFKVRAVEQQRMLQGKSVADTIALEGCSVGPLKADRRGRLVARLEPLKRGATYKLHVKSTSQEGESDYSADVFVKTVANEDSGPGIKLVPLSWLLGATYCVGIAAEESARTGQGAFSYVRSVARVLNSRLMDLRRVFAYYKSGQYLTSLKFIRMLRDVGLMQGCTPAQATLSKAKLLGTSDVDLRFQRLVRSVSLSDDSVPASMPGSAIASAARVLTTGNGGVSPSASAKEMAPGIDATRKKSPPPPKSPPKTPSAARQQQEPPPPPQQQQLAPLAQQEPRKSKVEWRKVAGSARSFTLAELREAARRYHEEMVKSAGEEAEVIVDPVAAGDAASGLMAPFQFVAALIECSWQCYPSLVGLERRLTTCIDAILAVVMPLVDGVKKKRVELNSANVRALFVFFDKDLRKIFRAYAEGDQAAIVADVQGNESINLAELKKMLSDCSMMDDNLTNVKLQSIFAEVNVGSAEEGIDENDSEMSYDEFLSTLALICDVKIPEKGRSRDGFEYTLYAWLQLQFIPTCRRLINAKAKGKK